MRVSLAIVACLVAACGSASSSPAALQPIPTETHAEAAAGTIRLTFDLPKAT